MTKNICRACLSEQKLEYLCDWHLSVDDINEVMTYRDCFQLCTQLDVMKADSIHFLCGDCVQELLNSYRFITKAQKASHELHSLSLKDENSCDIKTNEFELIIIQNLSKSDESTDASKKPEHTFSEEDVEGSKVTAVDSDNLKQKKHNVEESNNPLLPPTGTTSKRILNTKRVSDTWTGIQGFEDPKTNSTMKLDDSEWDSVVKEEMAEYIDEAPALLTENLCSNELREEILCSVDCNSHILKKDESKPKKILKNSTTRKMLSKAVKGRKGGTEYKQTPCEYCKKLFPENKLKQHLSRYHRPKIFLCDMCPSSFSIANNLRRHQRTHDLNRERNFTCNDCGRKFFTEDVYRTHIKIHSSSRQAQFKCSYCDKVFLHKGSLTLHLQKHTGPKNECNICKKRYVRKIDLEVHMRNHSGDLPYQCSKCGKAFMTTSALRKHELLHSGIRFKCDICNKEYSHPSKLSRHRLEHTGLPLKCAMCNKGFAEPNKIKRHIRSVHKVEDVEQMNNFIIRVSKKDESSTKDSSCLQLN